MKLELKEVENENLRLKADFEALRASNLEKELEAVKLEHERQFLDLRRQIEVSVGRARKGVGNQPSELCGTELKDDTRGVPGCLSAEDFTVTHNTKFSVDLINFAV